MPENKKGNGERALPGMEGVAEANCRKTLELQKILSQCVGIKEISQKKVESKKVEGNGGEDLAKLGRTS
ncbi:hypothetical protein Pyn_14427 [Prunus yedoensis var. nudiflora]|uniref:Uncharacterized protein n=1 Tax=Prunus yedoensis var. nudiflora TaxID=2094558 RepID=A0A314Y2L7_PRUYE|nr:hypothetical protein Pyn_14427 [Prunus yedoensis var. nudiflora]